MLFVVEQKKDRSVGPRVFDSAGLLGGHRALRSFVRARGGLPVTSLYPTDRIAASANSGLAAGLVARQPRVSIILPPSKLLGRL